MFVGDSPVRRKFTRLIARVEGLSDEETDALQLDFKNKAHQNKEHSFCIDYGKQGRRIRICETNNFDYDRIADYIKLARKDSFRVAYVGFPLAHMLWPSSQGSCRVGGSAFPAYISDNFKGLVRRIEAEATSSNTHVVFGTGVPFSSGVDLICPSESGPDWIKGCKSGACAWPADNRGAQKANAIHKQVFDAFAKPYYMHYFDTYSETLATRYYADEKTKQHCSPTPVGCNVHFLNPVLDEQLDRLFDRTRTWFR